MNNPTTESLRKYGPVLIVDDEKEIGEILGEMFEPNFEKVILCTNAQEAIGATKATQFSMIVCDINMPGLSGEQMVRQLRASGDLTPVIFVTCAATTSCFRRALNLGVSDVFEKPFDADHILSSVDRILEIEKRRQKLYMDIGQNILTPEEIKKEKKILGLLLVVNESKHAA
jgi:DNA-binding NtrC family response regulator